MVAEKKLKKTPFNEFHISSGAKMIEFAGFEMPLSFESIIKEALHTRRSISLFDVSHMGRVEIRGNESLEFLSFITSNDPGELKNNEVQYSLLLTHKGTIVDDLLVYKLENGFLCVVNAANKEKDLDYMKKISDEKFKKVDIIDKTEEVFQVAIQGPRTQPFLEELFDLSLAHIPYYTYAYIDFLGNKLLVSRTGYTGEDGFEIYGELKFAKEFWDTIIKKGKKFNVKPAGLGARDILRLEMGYPLYGNELSEEITPIEANLSRFVKFEKKNFLGKDILIELKKKGTEKKLIGLVTKEKGGIPRKGNEVFLKEEKIGYVTSGGYSPFLEETICMSYVKREKAKEENLEIAIRNRKIKFKRVELPFIKSTSIKRKNKRKQ